VWFAFAEHVVDYAQKKCRACLIFESNRSLAQKMSSLEKKHREIISPRFTDIITPRILPVRIELKVNADKLLCWCILTTREQNARTKIDLPPFAPMRFST
jgi:hypothetical protein